MNEVINKFVTMAKDNIKGLNLFTILQVLWVIELYFLMSNSIFAMLIRCYNNQSINILNIPNEVIKINNLIFDKIDNWIVFAVFLGITMLLTGIVLTFLKFIPFISKYELINLYSDYGIGFSSWIILMAISYWIYKIHDVFFPVVFIIICITVILLIEIMKKIKSKLLGEI